MRVEEVSIPGIGTGLLRQPDTHVSLRAALVALHGASRPQRSQPLFDHLAEVLTPLGCAVLTYDRRASRAGNDVPLTDQSADARTALRMLSGHLRVRVGLYAFSQGAWAASVAASLNQDGEQCLVSFLALLGCSGVSPAVQMRYFTDENLRRSGYAADVRAKARELRIGLENAFRGRADRRDISAMLAAASQEPWFRLTYLPSEMPPQGVTWDDMDFDPAAVIARVRCPTLLIYGADEECVPAAERKRSGVLTASAISPSPTCPDADTFPWWGVPAFPNPSTATL